jgi:hypothetical protein
MDRYEYNSSVEASMQGYIKGSLGPFITVQYKGSVEASKQGYSKGTLGPSITVN